jgi:hypothetical protein
MIELEGSKPIINTPPHLSRDPKEIREKKRFWLQEHRQRVRETIVGTGGGYGGE